MYRTHGVEPLLKKYAGEKDSQGSISGPFLSPIVMLMLYTARSNTRRRAFLSLCGGKTLSPAFVSGQVDYQKQILASLYKIHDLEQLTTFPPFSHPTVLPMSF